MTLIDFSYIIGLILAPLPSCVSNDLYPSDSSSYRPDLLPYNKMVVFGLKMFGISQV